MVTTAAPLRIVFFGTPEFAVPTFRELLASRHVVAGVVTQPDRPRGRFQHVRPSPVKEVAQAHRVPVLQPERLRDEAFLRSLRELNADLGVVAAYGKILPEAVLQAPRMGLVNVHASLLPKYRGAAPIHRAVMAGESTTGVTIMRVVKALDAGPMLSAVSRAIGPDDTSVDVERDLAQIGADALIKAVNGLAAGPGTETPQDEAVATYAPRLQKMDGVVDWATPAAMIHNQIRGLHPWPHAYSDLEGERCILLESRVDAETNAHGALEPGTILEATGDVLRVQAGQGTIRLLRLQMEGRRPVSAREFLAGRRSTAGARFVRCETDS